MEDDTALDPHDGPKMFLVYVDLDMQLEQWLESAFQQSNCMLNLDADL